MGSGKHRGHHGDKPPLAPQSLHEQMISLMDRIESLERDRSILREQIDWLRQRMASLLPEPVHCKYCKARISKYSTNCGACGRVLVTEPVEKGIPR